MALDITKTLVKKTLQAHAKLKPIPQQWSDSSLLTNNLKQAPQEAAFELEELFKNLVYRHLKQQRSVAGMPEVYPMEKNAWLHHDKYVDEAHLIEALQNDLCASKRNSKLKGWSMLYHSYFVIPTLSPAEMARHIPYSERQLRNLRHKGIAYLTESLRKVEIQNCTVNQAQLSLEPATLYEQHAVNQVNEARSLLNLGAHDAVIQKCDEIIVYAVENRLSLAYVLAHTIRAYAMLHHPAHEVEEAERYLKAAEQHELFHDFANLAQEAYAQTEFYTQSASIAHRLGRFAEALALANKAVQGAQLLQTIKPMTYGNAYRVQSNMFWVRGDYHNAIRAAQHALKTFQQNNLRNNECHALDSLGVSYLSLGRFAEAAAYLERASDLACDYHNYWRFAFELGLQGYVHLLLGDIRQGHFLFQKQLENAQKVQSQGEIARAHTHMGMAYLCERNLERARHFLTIGHDHISRQYRPLIICMIHAHFSQLETLCGNHQQAYHHAQDLWELANDLDSDPARVLAHRCLSSCELIDHDERINHLHQVRDLAYGTRIYDLTAATLALGYLSDDEEKPMLWQQGLDMLDQLGANAWRNCLSAHQYPHLPLLL